MKKIWVAPLVVFALSACGDEAAEPVSTETGGEAAGEILGGTISDDMIALEELTSTSPPAERSAQSSSSAPSNVQPLVREDEAAPEGEEPAPEPQGPVTAGPGRPVPQTEEAGGTTISPPAF